MTEAMHAEPASFLGLIGTFRHRYTSLQGRIIGVPKYGVKETPSGLDKIISYAEAPPAGRTNAKR